MTKQDATAFLIALNNISGYVPPMMMQAVTGNPICRVLEQIANAPDQAQTGAAGNNAASPPKPHLVDTGGGG